MIDDLSELGRLADLNLAATWVTMGRAIGAAVGGSDACPFVASGIPAAFFNGVYATGPTSDPDTTIRDAVTFMAAQQVPWLLWVREGVDDALLEAGRRAGLTDAGGPPAMGLTSIGPTPPNPDGLVIELVGDEDGIDVTCDLIARGFEMPVEIAHQLVEERTIAEPGIAVVVGKVNDEPVTTALVSVTGTTAGIYNVATPPEHRNRGFGAAATWAAIEQGARLGCDHAVLQASPSGAPVYHAMGFVDLGRYIQLEGQTVSVD
jgi:hypothetical protein